MGVSGAGVLVGGARVSVGGGGVDVLVGTGGVFVGGALVGVLVGGGLSVGEGVKVITFAHMPHRSRE